MRKKILKTAALLLALVLCFPALSGCAHSLDKTPESDQHQPLTILTNNIDYTHFEALLQAKYPEVRLEFVSYTGGNGTGYAQYLLDNGKTPDIFTISIFSTPEQQKKSLLDLSGYEFLSNYKTADINQVALDGAVYLVPASSSMIGLYYNKTLFAENNWAVPASFEELIALTAVIRESGIDPAAAQFELPGNGFFDLFTLAKTDFLSTPDGIQWERDFKLGNASAQTGLSDAANQLQTLIDCGFLDAEDTMRTYEECENHFYSGQAAMYVNAGTLPRFTQNEDGTGDQYGIMPFPGLAKDTSVLITKPLCYFGLSNALSAPGNEQKLEDALKVMALLATEEGQQSLVIRQGNYIVPLKNTKISEDSPFIEVEETIRSGHTSTLAYAGYEPIIIGVGEKVRDWVTGKCSGADVLALADALQGDYLSGDIPPIAVAEKDFTLEESAQLQAEAFRQAAGADIGLVSLGGYHDGVENPSGVCGLLFKGNIDQMVVNALPPAFFGEPLCVLTLTGADVKALLETGFVVDPGVEGFPYIPSGIIVSKTPAGLVEEITWADGSPFDESASYQVAIDKDGYTDEIAQKGSLQETELVIIDVLAAYLKTNSPVSPLAPSIK